MEFTVAQKVSELYKQTPCKCLSHPSLIRTEAFLFHKAMTSPLLPCFNMAVKSTRIPAPLRLNTGTFRCPREASHHRGGSLKTTRGRCANLASKTYWRSLLTQRVCSLQRNAMDLSLSPVQYLTSLCVDLSFVGRWSDFIGPSIEKVTLNGLEKHRG